jgi:hypothetical protein
MDKKPAPLLVIGLLIGAFVGDHLYSQAMNGDGMRDPLVVLACAGLGLALGYVADVFRSSRSTK